MEAEDSKFMFDSTKPKMKGAKVGENGSDDEKDEKDVSKMSYDELCAYLADNPDAKLE